MAERSRVNSSTAAAIASGGKAGFNRFKAAWSSGTNTTSPVVSRPNRPASPSSVAMPVLRGGPATVQPSSLNNPDRGLLDQMVLGVAVGFHFKT